MRPPTPPHSYARLGPGWNEHVLPDGARYFVHASLRVTADVDPRTHALDLFKPEGLRNGPWERELWLREPAPLKVPKRWGKRKGAKGGPVRMWVDHSTRSVNFEGREVVEDRESSLLRLCKHEIIDFSVP